MKKLTELTGAYCFEVESSEVIEFIEMEPVTVGSTKVQALAYALQKAEMQSGEDFSDQGLEVSGFYYEEDNETPVTFTTDEVRGAQNFARLHHLVD